MDNNPKMNHIKKEKFGNVNEREIYIYTLTNRNNFEAKIINYGAILVSLKVPDRNGIFKDIVTGFDSLEGYVNDKSFFGAIVGRYGNRIAKAKFRLNGKQYQLTVNDGGNHLHGGKSGFYKAIWEAEPSESESSIKLYYSSPDGEEGYPGKVDIAVVYTLTDENELQISYEGVTDRATILNPTHHSYFNLSGDFNKDILHHLLFINADFMTPVDQTLIPTGQISSVRNTPFDFRKPAEIGLRINEKNEQLAFGKGYDHNWVLNDYTKGKLRQAASLYDSTTGRFMEVITDQPGLQFYSGNFLDGTIRGKKGVTYKFRSALCLETQHFPDSPNKTNFPSVTLNPGEVYRHTTIYKFSIK